jgi:dGTPase
MEQSVYRLRDYMFITVYDSPIVRSELTKAKAILRMLYTYYLEHTTEICSNISIFNEADKHRLVCDFIAGMTDQFALATYEELFLPKRWKIRSARSTWNI